MTHSEIPEIFSLFFVKAAFNILLCLRGSFDEIFRQINSLEKTVLSRNFYQKVVLELSKFLQFIHCVTVALLLAY